MYIASVSDSAGRSVSYNYDDSTASVMTSFTDARNKTTTYTYDDEYQLSGIKEPAQTKEVWRNIYTDGRVTKQLDGFDSTFTFSYDTSNSQTLMIDRRGNQTVVDYDNQFWTTKATDPFGFFSEYTYGDIDLPASVIDENGWTSTFAYDANGNTTGTIDQEGHSVTAGYDLANNNLLWAKDALGRQTTYNYDGSGKFLESIVSPVGNTLFDYFTDGLVKSVTDDNSRTTNFEYNAPAT